MGNEESKLSEEEIRRRTITKMDLEMKEKLRKGVQYNSMYLQLFYQFATLPCQNSHEKYQLLHSSESSSKPPEEEASQPNTAKHCDHEPTSPSFLTLHSAYCYTRRSEYRQNITMASTARP
jgi:hypothetical protein